MRIEQIPVLKDNYIYILVDDKTGTAAVVDPAVSKEVIAFLKNNNLKLTKIFNTHHHGDHVGGNSELIKHYGQVEVFASYYDKGRIPEQSVFLEHGDTVSFAGETATVYFVPGHTKGHIVYHFSGLDEKNYAFVGDTLFSGGCGRLFEGSYEEMFNSLTLLRGHFKNNTVIYCAHEYTVRNYSVLCELEPENMGLKEKLNECLQKRSQGHYTVPFSFLEEKKYNSFLRWDDPCLKAVTGTLTDLETFTFIRKYRDNF